MAKVCAHINTGPFQNTQKVFPSIKAAIDYFKTEVVDSYYSAPSDESDGCYAMTLYFIDDDCGCDSMMNFHDYPDRKYSIGPRGAMRKDYI